MWESFISKVIVLVASAFFSIASPTSTPPSPPPAVTVMPAPIEERLDLNGLNIPSEEKEAVVPTAAVEPEPEKPLTTAIAPVAAKQPEIKKAISEPDKSGPEILLAELISFANELKILNVFDPEPAPAIATTSEPLISTSQNPIVTATTPPRRRSGGGSGSNNSQLTITLADTTNNSIATTTATSTNSQNVATSTPTGGSSTTTPSTATSSSPVATSTPTATSTPPNSNQNSGGSGNSDSSTTSPSGGGSSTTTSTSTVHSEKKLKSSSPLLIQQGGFISINFDDGELSAFEIGRPIVEEAGIPATYYIVTHQLDKPDFSGYISEDDVKRLEADGNEIGNHSQNHPHLRDIATSSIIAEINGAQDELERIGIDDVKTFAYPYGEVPAGLEDIFADAGIIGARGTGGGINLKNTNPYNLKSWSITDTTTFAEVKAFIDKAVTQNGWGIITLHFFNRENDKYSIRPELLQQIVDYLVENNIPVTTNAEGLKEFMGR